MQAYRSGKAADGAWNHRVPDGLIQYRKTGQEGGMLLTQWLFRTVP